MTSSCDAPHLNPALLRRLSWLCTGACLALVAYAFTDVRRNTASLGSVLIEQAASRREYALVDERDTPDYPREAREGYEEPRLRDERYGDDVVYETPRGQEFATARDSEELERGTADDRATVAQPSNAWFTTLVSSGKSQVDQVHAALHDLYQAATGQEPLISERQGHHDARVLASYVNGEEVSPGAEPAAASHDSEIAAASDSIPTAAASHDSEIAASSEIAVKSEGIQTAATPHHSETAAASDDSETLQELAKQVDEMTEQAEANQQSIQTDAQGVLSSDGEDDVNSLAARLNGVEETNVENQQAVGSALTTPNSKSEKH